MSRMLEYVSIESPSKRCLKKHILQDNQIFQFILPDNPLILPRGPLELHAPIKMVFFLYN